MSEALYVTPAQVEAAKLILDLNEEAGSPPDEALEAIANAQVVATPQSGRSPTATADEESLATLQRIERQLRALNPEDPAPGQSQRSTQLGPPSVNTRDVREPPWYENRPAARSWPNAPSEAASGGVNPPPIKWYDDEHPGGSQIGPNAEEPPVGRPVRDMSKEEEIAIDDYFERKQQREQRGPGGVEGPDQPPSRGGRE
jgi:hypothetical protein